MFKVLKVSVSRVPKELRVSRELVSKALLETSRDLKAHKGSKDDKAFKEKVSRAVRDLKAHKVDKELKEQAFRVLLETSRVHKELRDCRGFKEQAFKVPLVTCKVPKELRGRKA